MFSTKNVKPENLEELIDFRVAVKERTASGHLGENAANAPDVDGARVARRAQQHFGRTIPERDDLVRVDAYGNAEGARQAEVGQLDHAVLVDEQVLRLEIAMHGASLMAVEYALCDLMEVALDELRLEQLVVGQRLHVLLEVHGEELEDQVELVLLHEHVHERDDVGMLKLAQQRDLAYGRARHALLVVLQADFLERHQLIGDLVLALVDDAVRALADLLDLDVVRQRVAHLAAAAHCVRHVSHPLIHPLSVYISIYLSSSLLMTVGNVVRLKVNF